MRKNRLYEENLLVNGEVGGEELSSQERQTLQDQAAELKTRMERAKDDNIAE